MLITEYIQTTNVTALIDERHYLLTVFTQLDDVSTLAEEIDEAHTDIDWEYFNPDVTKAIKERYFTDARLQITNQKEKAQLLRVIIDLLSIHIDAKLNTLY